MENKVKKWRNKSKWPWILLLLCWQINRQFLVSVLLNICVQSSLLSRVCELCPQKAITRSEKHTDSCSRPQHNYQNTHNQQQQQHQQPSAASVLKSRLLHTHSRTHTLTVIYIDICVIINATFIDNIFEPSHNIPLLRAFVVFSFQRQWMKRERETESDAVQK